MPLELSAEQINGWVGIVLWPLFRVAGLLAILPTIGGGEVPVRVRVGLAVLITVLIVPTLDPMPQVDPLSPDSVLITFQQLLIGLAMGLIVLVVFNAVTLAGESIAITMGLGFALMNDPQNGVQVPTVSQFYLVMATLLFLAMNGHHAILHLLHSSFTLLPVGMTLGAGSFWLLLEWGAFIFLGALTIALPALAAMLSVNVVMGVITRSAPQMNLFSVGFPITMTVGFFAIMLTLPGFKHSFENLLKIAESTVVQLLRI
ncbi:MAG: flagellar biosynthetic protein FliR [Granulosicoccus sp.]